MNLRRIDSIFLKKRDNKGEAYLGPAVIVGQLSGVQNSVRVP